MDLRARAFPGVQGGAHTQGERRDLTGRGACSAGTGGEGREGTGGGGRLSRWRPGRSGGVSTPCLWGRAGSRRIWSFKMYNIENCKICLQF